MGTILTNQYYIYEEGKRLNVESACYHSIQNLMSPCPSKNRNIKICNNIILPVCMYLKRGLTFQGKEGAGQNTGTKQGGSIKRLEKTV